MSYYVYLLRCADDTLYCGITTNLDRRIEEHNALTEKGAKYTRGRQPVALVYSELYDDRASASKREHEIKKLSKREKEQLITTN